MSTLNHSEAVRQQFATDEILRIRHHIHDTYSVPRVNYPEWVLSNMYWRGDERILDAGCGSGTYFKSLADDWPDIQYYGLDFSMGMLIKHPATGRIGLADVQHIPFADGTFDVVMANHMLYHVPDIDRAITEIRRVLKPSGILLAATNSLQNMPELQVLMRRAVLLLARSGATQVKPPAPASDRFALENGSRQLSHYFYAVMRADLPGRLVFPEIEPVMEYLESTRALRESQLPADVAWEDVMMIMRQQVTHLVNHLGELSISKLNGVLLATDDGGFIEEFIKIHAGITADQPE